MSGIFSKPKSPKLPPTPQPITPPVQPEQIEEVSVIQEDEADVTRRARKRLLKGGRRSTILAGITQALKKRLGE